MKLFARQAAQLSLRNRAYKKLVTELLELLLVADVGSGDVTTRLLKNPRQKVRAEIRAKQSGVLAGLAETELFLRHHDVKLSSKKSDGATVARGELVATVGGTAEKILTTERVALNLLQRMSGIATAMAQLVKRCGRGKIAATRKTPLGWLDVRAVVLGGGLAHRLNLNDQILVKENHRAIEPQVWQNIRTQKLFEVEVDSAKLALEVAKFFHDKPNLILLLDNFSPTTLKKLVPQLRTLNPKIILEASGGITPGNIRSFLATSVDFVSLGWLTHSSVALDLSLKIAPPK